MNIIPFKISHPYFGIY